MAEIKIREKKPIWPWILIGALILAAILYFAVYADDDDMDDVNTEEVMDMEDDQDEMSGSDQYNNSDQSANTSGSSDHAIANYTEYIGDSSKMGIDHEYSHGALTYLIEAVQAKANELGVDTNSDMQQARQSANAVTKDPYELHHADNIKKSAMIIVNALSNIQKQKFPELGEDVSKVKSAAEAISKEEHTLNQKGDITKFYNSAKSLLLKMK